MRALERAHKQHIQIDENTGRIQMGLARDCCLSGPAARRSPSRSKESGVAQPLPSGLQISFPSLPLPGNARNTLHLIMTHLSLPVRIHMDPSALFHSQARASALCIPPCSTLYSHRIPHLPFTRCIQCTLVRANLQRWCVVRPSIASVGVATCFGQETSFQRVQTARYSLEASYNACGGEERDRI